ncbi:molybdate ABC transporter permease subunit [Algihabitans sp.]|uniref:molybdate ABC transporter permease subunit n=1 Tax=Algihabitans sp. TaxID=2821514 RepID=UPI003BACC05E
MFDLSANEIAAIELSLRVGLWSVAGGLLPALAAAWLLARCDFPGKLLFDGLIHLPLVVPPVVIGYLLLVLLGRNGPLGQLLDAWFGLTVAFTWQGAAVASAVMAFPLMVRAMRLSLETVDRKLEAAARTLGAPPWQVFATVTLPLMAPGLLAALLLGFARSLGEFGATITFVSNIPGETRTLPLALYTFTQTPGGEAGALRLAMVSVLLALLALAGSELLARRLRRQVAG